MSIKTYRLKSWQDGFIFSKVRYPCLRSGWATGKTLALILAAVKHCTDYKGALALIIRKDFVDLRDSTMKDFTDYTAGTGLKIDSNKDVKFPNGSMLMFRHGDEMEGLQNINLSWFGIEQGEEFDSNKQFHTLRGRLRRANVPFHQGCVICNANGHNWIYQLWNTTTDKEFALFEATSLDNKEHIAEKTLEDWKKLEIQDPPTYRRMVMNSSDDADTTSWVIPERFIRECFGIHNINSPKVKLISIDPAGGGDDRAVMYALENTKIIDQEILSTVENKKVTCGYVVQLKHRTQSTHITGDNIGVGWELFNELDNQGHKTMGLNSSEKSSDVGRFYNLKAEMWWNAREMFINHEVEMIDDTELITELSIVKYTIDSNGQLKLESKDITKKRLGRSPDKADAYIYGLWAHKKLLVEVAERHDDSAWAFQVPEKELKHDEMALGVRSE
jgi:hypothetical protein